MPQLDAFIIANITIYSAIFFILLIFIFFTYFVPKIYQALRVRELIRTPLEINIDTKEEKESEEDLLVTLNELIHNENQNQYNKIN